MFKFTKTQLKDVHCVNIYEDGIALYASKSVHVGKDLDVDATTLRVFHGRLPLHARNFNPDTKEYKYYNISYIEFYNPDAIFHGVKSITVYIDNRSAYSAAQYPDLHSIDIYLDDASDVQHSHRSTSVFSGGFNVYFEDIDNPLCGVDLFESGHGYGKGSVDNINRTGYDLVEDYRFNELSNKWEKEN